VPGQAALRAALQDMAEAGAQGDDLQGFLDAAQRDMERVVVFGFAEETVQAGLQEVQFVKEGVEPGLLVALALVGQGPAEMFGMAGEGRRGEAIEGRQGAQGHTLHQGAIDLGKGGMMTDGAEAGSQAGLTLNFRHAGYSWRFDEMMVPHRRDACATWGEI
jgi:hypothetical protein